MLLKQAAHISHQLSHISVFFHIAPCFKALAIRKSIKKEKRERSKEAESDTYNIVSGANFEH